MDLIKRRLEEINRRLNVARIGVALEIRGKRLYLRGTFPPKPGKSAYSQQRISLGVYANSDGLDFAESEAKIIGGLLAQNKFDWAHFLAEEIPPVCLVGYWIDRLENNYFSTHQRNPTSEQTWKIDYYQPLAKLPQDQQLSKELLEQALFSETRPNTRSRRRYALAYALLSDLAKIDHRFRELVGNYSIKAVSPRSLPDDHTIAAVRDSFDSPSWQWAYGMQATFGLRNHEIFFTDLDDWPIAYVWSLD
ncbi:MAG: integrase [Microcystis aeruginosa S11-05]|nr:integrase [Microcystis aeruginosa S11-05]